MYLSLPSPKLVSLIQTAQQRVPYYSDLLGQVGFDPSIILSDPLAFSRIPLLTRSICQQHAERMVATDLNPDNLFIDYTSGTTGVPIRCLKTPWEYLQSEKTLWGHRNRWDSRLCEVVRAQLRSDHNVVTGVSFQFRGKHLVVSLGRATDSVNELRVITATLNEYRPGLITGVTETVRQWAHLIERDLVPELSYRPRLIEIYGDFLSDQDRLLIERVFSCQVANIYASREVYGIAYTCPSNTFHVITENVFLEILPASQHNNLSQGVVTGLTFHSMPFIRYLIGDIIEPGNVKCQCGWDEPTITLTRGRTADTIAGYDGLIGSYVFPALFDYINTDEAKVLWYQVIQEEIARFVIFILRGKGYTIETELYITSEVREIFGEAVDIEIRYQAKNDLESKGKNMPFVCRVPSQ